MARVYGIASFANGHGMIVNSFQPEESVEVAEARDESGKVIDSWAYSRVKNFTASGVYDDGSEVPRAGTIMVLNGENYLVTNVGKPENNVGATELSIQCSHADNATIHPYGESSSSSSSSDSSESSSSSGA